VHQVDVNRYFLASNHIDSPRRHVYKAASSCNDELAATIYVRLDTLRILLAVIDFFVVLHRCVCLGCCCCCWQSGGQLIAEAVTDTMRNGVAGGSGVSQCLKHDATRPHRMSGRAPNGSVSRPLSSFDVCDEEDVDDVPDELYALRRCRRREEVSIKATVRRSVGGSVWRRRLTQEQRRRRRHLTSLLTRLMLCSIVVSLLYIVIRSLDVILAELQQVATKQLSVNDLWANETFLSETFAHQVSHIQLLLLNRE